MPWRAHLVAHHSYEQRLHEASGDARGSADREHEGTLMRLMFVYWAFEDQGSGLVSKGIVTPLGLGDTRSPFTGTPIQRFR